MLSIEDFIDRSSRPLLRTAWLLTGNWASAEDLVQTALLQSWRHWDSIRSEPPELYVRRVLLNTFLTGQRRRWSRERPVAELPGQIQQFTPGIDLLFTPDIDASLDEEGSKRAFWSAFRVLGEWYADLPPY